MRNIRFSCFQCGQHLVAEGEWSGLDIHCPGCAIPLTIPAECESVAAERAAHEGELQSLRADRDRLAAEREASAAEHDGLAAERTALATEVERLKGMLEMAEMARGSLQSSLREAKQEAWEKKQRIKHIQERHESVQADWSQDRRLIIDQESQLQASREKTQEIAGENRQLAGALAKHEQLLEQAREETRGALQNAEGLNRSLEETKGELGRALAACEKAEAEAGQTESRSRGEL